jgi:hypothetical protein
MVTRRNVRGGSRGSCGGTRRRDGSGRGVGNVRTPSQPRRKKR